MKRTPATAKARRKRSGSTPAQRAALDINRRLIHAWNFELTDNERMQWDRESRDEPKRKKHSHGYQFFKHVNFPYLRAGRPIFRRPPSKGSTGSFTCKGVEARNRKGKFTLAFLNPANDREPDFYIVRATPAGSPGRVPNDHSYTDIHSNAALADLADLGAAYLRVYGKRYPVPKPGQRLGVRLIGYYGGYHSLPKPFDVIVGGP